MIRLEMLPAAHGDCLLLEYGKNDDIEHRVLIDGGPGIQYREIRSRLEELPTTSRGKKRKIDLLVVTHVDADHIEGVITLLQDEDLGLTPADVWFNDWNHLAALGTDAPRLGPEQGEFLGALLERQERKWNRAFDGETIVVPDDEDDELQTWRAPGGLRLTVISPTEATLIKLRKKWKKAITSAGFQPGDREQVLSQFAARRWSKAPEVERLGDESRRSTLDSSEANGSSIGLLAEFGGRSMLLAGDAFADVLRPTIERLQRERDAEGVPLHVDVFKLPHHGSRNNATPQLMEVLSADAYAISTNGAKFGHPDREAINIIIEGHRGDADPRFLCNYRTRKTGALSRRAGIEVRYGDDAVVELDTE